MITPIAVQRPDVLMETQGLTELRRITTTRAILVPESKQIMIVWASALEQDWVNGGAKELFETLATSFTLLPGV